MTAAPLDSVCLCQEELDYQKVKTHEAFIMHELSILPQERVLVEA